MTKRLAAIKPVVGRPDEEYGEEWERSPPADVMIGAGYRVHFGDWSITFDGTDTGRPFDAKPWAVDVRMAVGTLGAVAYYYTEKRFTQYRAAIKYAMGRERARRRALGAKPKYRRR